MRTEDKQAHFFDLYSNYNFEDLKPDEQAFVLEHFSVDAYQEQRQLHLMLDNVTEEAFDTALFKDEILNHISPRPLVKRSVFNSLIPFYKVAAMLVVSLSLGLFLGSYIGQPIEQSQIQLAYQDTTQYYVPEAIPIKCTEVAIMSENLVNPNQVSENEIKTISTCEMKEILKNQPKRVDNQMIKNFPVVSF